MVVSLASATESETENTVFRGERINYVHVSCSSDDLRLLANRPLQQTNAPTIVLYSQFIQVRSQLNARTLAGHYIEIAGGKPDLRARLHGS